MSCDGCSSSITGRPLAKKSISVAKTSGFTTSQDTPSSACDGVRTQECECMQVWGCDGVMDMHGKVTM